MKNEHGNFSPLVVNELPNGSKILVDPVNGTVLALSSAAGGSPRGLSQGPAGTFEPMRASSGLKDPEEPEAGPQQTQEGDLQGTPDSSTSPTRRRVVGSLGATIALPLVVSLTLSEQRAYAEYARSFDRSPHPRPVTPPPPPPRRWRW